MRRYRIVYDDKALSDLADLEVWIGSQASPRTASGYTARIRKCCSRLRHFPERGAIHDDIRPGIRVMGFEGRVDIAFEIHDDRVIIIRILYAGRQFDSR